MSIDHTLQATFTLSGGGGGGGGGSGGAIWAVPPGWATNKIIYSGGYLYVACMDAATSTNSTVFKIDATTMLSIAQSVIYPNEQFVDLTLMGGYLYIQSEMMGGPMRIIKIDTGLNLVSNTGPITSDGVFGLTNDGTYLYVQADSETIWKLDSGFNELEERTTPDLFLVDYNIIFAGGYIYIDNEGVNSTVMKYDSGLNYVDSAINTGSFIIFFASDGSYLFNGGSPEFQRRSLSNCSITGTYTSAFGSDLYPAMIGHYPYALVYGVANEIMVGLDPTTMNVVDNFTSTAYSTSSTIGFASDGAAYLYPELHDTSTGADVIARIHASPGSGSGGTTINQGGGVGPVAGLGSYDYDVNLRRYVNGTTLATPYSASIVLTNAQGSQITVNSDSTAYHSTYPIYTFTYPTGVGTYNTLYYPTTPITPLITAGIGSSGSANQTYTINLRRFENGTTCAAAYTASVVYTDGHGAQVSISADGYLLPTTYPIYTFTYPFSSGGNTRTLYYPTSPITPIIPDNASSTAVYYYTIRDPTGYLSGKTTFLSASKVVLGSETLLTNCEVTGKQHQAWFTLQQNQLVHLTLTYSNATVYDFGYFMPTTSNLVGNYLDMWMFGFTSGMWHVGQLIKVDSYWSGGDIVALYGATRAGTIDANIAIIDRLNSTVVYSGSAVANTTWTVPANSSRAYIVSMTGTHSLLGSQWSYVKILDPTTAVFPVFPTLPTNWTMGGLSMTIFAEFAIPAFFLLMFSYKWRNVGMIAAMLIATVQWGIGWAPFWTWELLAVGWMWALGWSVVIMESG